VTKEAPDIGFAYRDLAGNIARSSPAIATIITAAAAYIARQPNQVPTKPATVRASRIPMSMPPITIPTARPCASGFDSADAIGAITCGTTLNIPVISEVASSTQAFGAEAVPTSATVTISSRAVASPRRSTISPSGANNRSPSA
jgi:hypothetical protein